MPIRIVVADDDPNMRILMRDYLEAHGYEIFVAENGAEALEMIARHTPELVIVDYAMPLLTGWDVARRLRQDPKTAHLPILALTAHVVADADEQARAAGCDAYMTKPFQPSAIAAEIKRLLALHRQPT